MIEIWSQIPFKDISETRNALQSERDDRAKGIYLLAGFRGTPTPIVFFLSFHFY